MNIKYRIPFCFRTSQVLSFTFIILILSTLSSTALATKRKNVLFIIADDLNTMLACYGDPIAKTPNIDRLAARGVLFNHAYCTYPLCGPSRNSFLTGLYPNSTGILGNNQIFRQTIPTQISLPQAFRLDGYLAARLGKLYHYGVPNSIGTDGHDDPASWELQLNPAGVDRLEDQGKIFSLIPGQFGATLSWYASPKADDEHTDGKLAVGAEWVLEHCSKNLDRPFFLAVGFFRPHTPYVAPEHPYYDLYPLRDMPVAVGVKQDQANKPAAAFMSYKKEQDKLTDDLRRKALQGYYASISFMDAQVGKVIAALDRYGLSDDTIIVFTSDHGYHTGEHGLWQKQSLFENSAHVPLIIVVPGLSKKNTVSNTPVSHLDLYPTLTELTGVKAPKDLQGQSLVPMISDVSVAGRGWALTQVVRNPKSGERFDGYSLRTPNFRYTEWDNGSKGHELYDYSNDPKESNNIADLESSSKTVAALSEQLHVAIKTTFPKNGKVPKVLPGLWMPQLPEQTMLQSNQD